jgi:predicted Zn finger-like uncharacterized protein
VTIEVQCTSCHTRYRIDEQVLPEGTPTFKCSRCGHVFTFEPRPAKPAAPEPAAKREPPERAPEPHPEAAPAGDGEPPSIGGSERQSEPPPPSVLKPAVEPAASAAPRETAPPVASAAKRSATDDLMSRPIRDSDPETDPPTGESLSFDFADEPLEMEDAGQPEPAAEVPDDSERWSVGDEASFDAPAPEAVERKRAPRKPRKDPAAEPDFIDDAAAPIYNHQVTHSARFVLGLVLLVAFGYGALTLLVRSAPAAAADALSRMPLIGDRFVTPITPARLVALRAVHADYLRTKGGHQALVITGIAENVGDNPLHAVRIAVDLRAGGQRALASRSIFCGNTLSAAMVAQMTPHEIDFFQKLDPPKAFALEPAATTPFVVVFVDPPTGAARFDVMVADAVAAAPAPPDAG